MDDTQKRIVRPHLGGRGKPRKQYVRDSYSYDFKMQVISHLQSCGSMRDTIAPFFRSHHDTPQSSKRKMMNKWVTDRASIKTAASNGRTATHYHTRPSGIGCTLPAPMEAKLVKWVNDLRPEMLRLEACETAQEGSIPVEQLGPPGSGAGAS
ncbi:hypothetical protein PybrP1_011870 [[Pythium] brassicae (nom. inval.)]|nr:hypothetical protein PybrP1_011870 [[Pythium] brassicae (nom. inval.)]